MNNRNVAQRTIEDGTLESGIWERSAYARISDFKFRISNIVFLVILVIAAACSADTAQDHDIYTCPMHPTVVSDQPGPCPICGMDLVRRARPGEAVEITKDLAQLLKSPNQVITASVHTITGEYKSIPVSIEAAGVVTYDPRRIHTIPARVGGRIEKVFLKFAFQKVNKGQRVAEIYSPELITAQRELLFLLENDPENQPLISGAKTRLRLLGMHPGQIDNLVRKKLVANTFTIYSPYEGFVVDDDTTPPSSMAAAPSATGPSGGMDGMGSSPARPSQNASADAGGSDSFVREGSYVSAGETLFKIVNTDALRIDLDVPGTLAGVIGKGDRVELNVGKSENAIATVDLVQPFYSEGQNFLKVRVYIRETNEMQIGQLVTATILSGSKEALWLPQEAILDLGNEKIVFVSEGEVLKPKKVTTGIHSGNLIEIKSGLASYEEVAANAQYLVDSESFINVEN